MKDKNLKRRKSSAPKKGRKPRFSINQDPFFDNGSKRRRRSEEEEDEHDEHIESSSSDEDFDAFGEKLSGDEAAEGVELEEVEETVAERKKRIADKYLEKLRKIAERKKEEEEDEVEEREGEREGERDSLVAKMLQQEQLEDSGRMRRTIALRVQKPEISDGFRVLVKHRQPVTAVALSDDDLKGFSASKDGLIVHWDVNSGKSEKYIWPSGEVLKSQGAKDPQGRATEHSKHVLDLVISTDGRYLASGGLDRHIHIWDTRTRQHVRAFPGHRGPVSCLAFRQGTTELFSGSFDRTIKIWNVEDRAYINTLYGHQSEVLNVDCLGKERVLSVGRDRTMHLWKVPEETHLVFRAPASSLECCCFISNNEFLSGSDDGSIEYWSILRKKPICIVKNAHASLNPNNLADEGREGLSNGQIEDRIHNSESICLSAHSWVSSVTLCRNSDLAASGAGNGAVRLWAIESESKEGIQPLFELPLVGFVNSLAFSKSGGFLVAGVGQEPRLGRWGRIPAARNGVAVQRLKLS